MFSRRLIRSLYRLQSSEQILSFSLTEDAKSVEVVMLQGQVEQDFDARDWQEFVDASLSDGLSIRSGGEVDQYYHFLGGELRPGSGIVRAVDGVASGPAGTLTCLLSSPDGKEIFALGAGHVLTNFWNHKPLRLRESVRDAVYWDIKKFPGSQSSRFIGRLVDISKKPPRSESRSNPGAVIDLGLVKVEGDFTWKQRTTCYGSFGEGKVRGRRRRIYKGQLVTKCGAAEPHETKAVVEGLGRCAVVFGLDGKKYRFRQQVELRTAKGEAAAFAAPGDSGTMVVDGYTRAPLGMIFAGSVLDGIFLMTPIWALEKFWRRSRAGRLVLLRG